MCALSCQGCSQEEANHFFLRALLVRVKKNKSVANLAQGRLSCLFWGSTRGSRLKRSRLTVSKESIIWLAPAVFHHLISVHSLSSRRFRCTPSKSSCASQGVQNKLVLGTVLEWSDAHASHERGCRVGFFSGSHHPGQHLHERTFVLFGGACQQEHAALIEPKTKKTQHIEFGSTLKSNQMADQERLESAWQREKSEKAERKKKQKKNMENEK